jgi:hypothetical protein
VPLYNRVITRHFLAPAARAGRAVALLRPVSQGGTSAPSGRHCKRLARRGGTGTKLRRLRAGKNPQGPPVRRAAVLAAHLLPALQPASARPALPSGLNGRHARCEHAVWAAGGRAAPEQACAAPWDGNPHQPLLPTAPPAPHAFVCWENRSARTADCCWPSFPSFVEATAGGAGPIQPPKNRAGTQVLHRSADLSAKEGNFVTLQQARHPRVLTRACGEEGSTQPAGVPGAAGHACRLMSGPALVAALLKECLDAAEPCHVLHLQFVRHQLNQVRPKLRGDA